MSKPQRILMLAFPDCQLLDVTGPLQMLAGVNDELGRRAYELMIAAPKSRTRTGRRRGIAGSSVFSPKGWDNVARGNAPGS